MNDMFFMMLKRLEDKIRNGKRFNKASYSVTATTEGQTAFAIPHSGFSTDTCQVMVQSGRTSLLEGEDYTVNGTNIVLTEGVPVGRVIGISVMTLVGGQTADTNNVDGTNIAPSTLPLDRLSGGGSGEVPTKTDEGIVWKKTNAADVGASNPNLLINGDFQVWQRGTSFESAKNNIYTADRWFKSQANNVVEKTEDGIKITSSSTGGQWFLRYYIEAAEAKNLVGKTVTFSARVRKSRAFSVVLSSSISAATKYAIDLTNVSTDWVIVSGSISIDDIATKPFFGFVSHSGLNGTDWIEFDWVKMELGDVATPFVPRSYTEEFLACQRYLYSFDKDAIFVGATNASSLYLTLPINVPMRVKPSLLSKPAIYAGGEGLARTEITEYIVWTHGNNSIVLEIAMPSTFSGNKIYAIYTSGTSVLFDAEIY